MIALCCHFILSCRSKAFAVIQTPLNSGSPSFTKIKMLYTVHSQSSSIISLRYEEGANTTTESEGKKRREKSLI